MINYCWCCSSTIYKWLALQEDYCQFVERILPLLFQPKRILATRPVCKGSAPQLWPWPNKEVYVDTLWQYMFWGLLAQPDTKLCEQLVIEKYEHFVYHKYHISRVILVAPERLPLTTWLRMAVNNGQIDINSQVATIANNTLEGDKEGNMRYNNDGKKLCDRGDRYMVDCYVFGSTGDYSRRTWTIWVLPCSLPCWLLSPRRHARMIRDRVLQKKRSRIQLMLSLSGRAWRDVPLFTALSLLPGFPTKWWSKKAPTACFFTRPVPTACFFTRPPFTPTSVTTSTTHTVVTWIKMYMNSTAFYCIP